MRTGRPGRRRLAAALVASTLVLVVLIYLTFRKVELSDVWHEIRRVHLGILALALLVKAVTLTLMAWRSKLLFDRLHRFSIPRLFKSVVLGTAVNNAIPLRAGELARVGYLAWYGRLSPATCLAVVGLERLLDALCLLALLACTVAVVAVDLPVGTAVYWLAAGAGALAIIVIAIGRHPQTFVALCRRLGNVIGHAVGQVMARNADVFAEGLSALQSRRATAGVLLVSIAIWCSATFAIQIWFWAFDMELRWYAPMVVAVFLSFGLAVPSTPGHIGTYHLLVVAALATLGVHGAEARSVAIVGHAVAILPVVLIATPLIFRDWHTFASKQGSVSVHEDRSEPRADTDLDLSPSG